MAPLRTLERALEDSVSQRDTRPQESAVDEFLNAHPDIAPQQSSKLHESLLRLWRSSEVQAPKDTKNKNDPNENDTRLVFLTALNRLGECLVNNSELAVWWDELAPLAVDSTGSRRTVVDEARKFVLGVLSGSLYDYGGAQQANATAILAAQYGRSVLEVYLGVCNVPGTPSNTTVDEERKRFVRQNCRALFRSFALHYTAVAFTMVNDYFLEPEHRLLLLELVVEYFSESQHSKLFKVYETPFFESLLTCLERDTARVVLQLAVTALAMLVAHICDKMTTNNLLFRIFTCFGRLCSWQPTANSPDIPGWKKYMVEDEEDEDDETVTIKVVSLFTMLYGLFPINTLKFCRQCDEYFAKHKYIKTVSDFWSRFMVTRKAEELVWQFRVDPLLIKSNEENELQNSVKRFQELGSVLVLTSVCMSRHITDRTEITEPMVNINMETVNVKDNEATEGKESSSTVETRTESEEPKKELNEDSKDPKDNAKDGKDMTVEDTNLDQQQYLENHRLAFQTKGEGSAAHWHRELLLMHNELAFANFSLEMIEQRAVRWQKRAANRAVTESKNEELLRQNRILRGKVASLELEAQRAVRSARTIMRERSAYESKILFRNREFREMVSTLTNQVTELQHEADSARADEAATRRKALETQNKAAKLDEQLLALRTDLEVQKKQAEEEEENKPVLEEVKDEALEYKVDSLKFQLNELQKMHNDTVIKMKKDSELIQAELTEALAVVTRGSAKKPVREEDRERNQAMWRLRGQNEDLSRRCAQLEHELRARKVYEEERLNELQAALTSQRTYNAPDTQENKFRGRGGAQGVPRRIPNQSSTPSGSHSTTQSVI